jgi:hypothetical protein
MSGEGGVASVGNSFVTHLCSSSRLFSASRTEAPAAIPASARFWSEEATAHIGLGFTDALHPDMIEFIKFVDETRRSWASDGIA